MPTAPIPPVPPDIWAHAEIKGKFPQVDETKSFGEAFEAAINGVNKTVTDVGKLNMKLALGEIENIHEVMLAGEKAAIAMQLTLEIRNKVLEAYQAIMRQAV